MEATVIDISHLYKSYGDRTAIEDISFSVKKGKYLVFWGPMELVKLPP